MLGPRSLLLTFSIVAVALSGCADDPPAGDVGSSSASIPFDGSVAFEYTPFDNGYDVASTGDENADQLCNLDVVTENDPSAQAPTCQPAKTAISAMLHSAPEPSSDGFTLVLNGTEGERNIGALAQDEEGMWVIDVTFDDEDLSGMYENAQIRMGDLVVGTAATADGSNVFELASELKTVSFSGSYEGKKLMLDISGLADGVSYQGWLVSEDPDTLELTHDVSFSITSNGPFEYEAQENIDTWKEVHIHVAGSKINVGISTIA